MSSRRRPEVWISGWWVGREGRPSVGVVADLNQRVVFDTTNTDDVRDKIKKIW